VGGLRPFYRAPAYIAADLRLTEAEAGETEEDSKWREYWTAKWR